MHGGATEESHTGARTCKRCCCPLQRRANEAQWTLRKRLFCSKRCAARSRVLKDWQLEAVRAVHQFHRDKKRVPTVKELGNALHLTSHSHVQRLFDGMVDAGVLRRQPRYALTEARAPQ